MRCRVRQVDSHLDCQAIRLDRLGHPPATFVLLAPFDRLRPLTRAASWHRTSLMLTSVTVVRTVLESVGKLRLATTMAESPGLRLLGWQLEPARAVRGGRAARVLVADAVGLGKTVQAGLTHVALAHDPAYDRTLVVTPAGLRDQWCTELARLFGTQAAVMDAGRLRHLRRTLPAAVNPWGLPGVYVTTIDFIKQPEILAGVLDVWWTLVVFDEAHGLAGTTDRHRAADLVGRAADHVLLLTATPHSGDPASFAQLCRIGEMRDGGPLIVRRSRAQVGLATRRQVRNRCIPPGEAERRLHRALHAYLRRIRAEGVLTADGAELAAWVLLKRSASSVRALRLTLARRHEALAGERHGPGQPDLPFELPGETQDDDVWVPAVVEMPGLRSRRAELEALRSLIALAIDAEPHDRKLRWTVRLIERLREPVLVFTEYRDTLVGIAEALGPAAVVLHGGLARTARRDAARAFVSGSARVLVATDAAGEGLNLHHRCRVVLSFDVPWNPTRLEQRIGRVDRIGQRRMVRAITLVPEGAAAVLIDRMNARLARIRQDMTEDATAFPAAAAAADEEALASAVAVLRAAAQTGRPPGATRARLPWTLVDACTRRRLGLPPGVLLLFHASGCTAAGEGIGACAAVMIELDSRVIAPRTARVLIDGCIAAAAASAATETAAVLGRILAGRRRYAAQVRVRLAAALQLRRSTPPAYQPGLFDRRAMTAALERRAAERTRRDAIVRALGRLDTDERVEVMEAPRPAAALVLR